MYMVHSYVCVCVCGSFEKKGKVSQNEQNEKLSVQK